MCVCVSTECIYFLTDLCCYMHSLSLNQEGHLKPQKFGGSFCVVVTEFLDQHLQSGLDADAFSVVCLCVCVWTGWDFIRFKRICIST